MYIYNLTGRCFPHHPSFHNIHLFQFTCCMLTSVLLSPSTTRIHPHPNIEEISFHLSSFAELGSTIFHPVGIAPSAWKKSFPEPAANPSSKDCKNPSAALMVRINGSAGRGSDPDTSFKQKNMSFEKTTTTATLLCSSNMSKTNTYIC